jgi:hypothetical protein
MPLFIVVHSDSFSIVGEAKQAQACGSAPGRFVTLGWVVIISTVYAPFFQKGLF